MICRSNTASPIPPAVQNNVWYSCRRLIYIKTNPKVNTPVGHWPIPESFWPEHSMTSLVRNFLIKFSLNFFGFVGICNDL